MLDIRHTSQRIQTLLQNIYKEPNFFVDTSIPVTSAVIDKANYVLPVITVKETNVVPFKLSREVSISIFLSPKPQVHYQPIDIGFIFEGNKEKPKHILLTSANNLANSLLVQNLLYRWANGPIINRDHSEIHLWDDFKFIFKINLELLLTTNTYTAHSPVSTFSAHSIAKLIYMSTGTSDLSIEQIYFIITQKIDKTLIILEKYDKLEEFGSTNIQYFLSFFSKYNVIITSLKDAVYVEGSSLVLNLARFHIDIELINEGLSPASVYKYLKNIFREQLSSYSEFTKLLRSDEELFKMAQSPETLKMLTHIWLGLGIKTNTQIYNQLYLMIGRLAESYKTEILSQYSGLSSFAEALEIKENLLKPLNHEVILKISKLSHTLYGLKTLKFTVGLLALHDDIQKQRIALDYLFDAIISSNPMELKIGGTATIALIMHLTAELTLNSVAIVQTNLLRYIDGLITADIHKWAATIIESGYSSITLVTKLQEMLEGLIKQDVIIALRIFSTINLDLLPQKRVLAILFQDKLGDPDLEVAEAASLALKAAISYAGVKEALLAAIDEDRRINVKIAAIDALKTVNEQDVIHKMVSLLETIDYWVYLATLKSLKELYIFSNQVARNIILNGLFIRLGKEFADTSSFQETVSLLKELRYEPETIIKTLSTEFQASREDLRLETIVDTIKSLFDLAHQGIKADIAEIFVNRLEALKSNPLLSLIYTEKHYNLRIKLKEALTILFPICSSEIRSKIYFITKNDLESKNGLLASTSVKTLETIFRFSKSTQEEIVSLLIANLDSTKTTIEGKASTIKSLNNLFEFLSQGQQLQIITKFTDLIFVNNHGEIQEAIYKFIMQHSLILKDASKNNDLIYRVLSLVENIITINFLENAYKFLTDLIPYTHSDSIKSRIFDVLESRVINSRIIGEQEAIVNMLPKIHGYLNAVQQSKIAKIFETLYEKILIPTALKEALEAGIITLGLSITLRNSMEDISFPELLDSLIQKYMSKTVVDSIDQALINSLFEKFLIITLNTNNPILFQRMLVILNKAIYDHNQVIAVLDQYADKSEQTIIIHKLSKIFHYDKELLIELQGLEESAMESKSDVASVFPAIDGIIKELGAFVEFVFKNNIEVKITRNAISFDGVDYLYATNFVNNKEYLHYANLLFEALNNPSNLLVKLSGCFFTGIFDAVDLLLIDKENVKLSIVRQVNVVGTEVTKPTNIFLIAEYKTVFGDILINRISINSGTVLHSVHSSLDKNYKIAVFGSHSDHIAYFIKSFFISHVDLEKIIELSTSWTSTKMLLKGTIAALASAYTEIEGEGILLNHNELIGHQELEERVSILENRLNILEVKITDELHALRIDLELAKQISQRIIEHINAMGNLVLPTHLSPYKQQLLLEIIHGLNSLHTAAMVVQTSMVHNSQQGIIGNVAIILEKVGTQIPVAGVAIDLLGLALSTIDEKIQDKLSKKIASLALDSIEMSQFAKTIALKIISSDLNIEAIRALKSSISYNMQQFATNIDLNLLRKAIDSVEELSTPTDEITRATNDAKDIICLITSFLITEPVVLQMHWQENYKLLEGFLTSKNIIIESLDSFIGPQGVSDVVPDLSVSQALSLLPKLELDTFKRRPSDASSTSGEWLVRKLSSDSIGGSPRDYMPRRMSEVSDDMMPPPLIRAASDLSKSISLVRVLSDTNKYNLVPRESDASLESQEYDAEIPGDILLIEDIKTLKTSSSPDMTGAIVANIVEVVPSIKYLLTKYIPIGPYVQDWSIVKDLAPYEHYLYSLIHAGANLYHVFKNLQDWQISLISSATFISRPFIYQYRDYLLSYLKDVPHEEAIKLAAYIATDTGLSFIENAVFWGVTPAALVFALLKGVSSGSINYYNSKENSDSNIFSDIIAKGTTTATLYGCYRYIQTIEELESKILAIPLICIPTAASTYLYTKYYVDISAEIGMKLIGQSNVEEG